MVNKLFRKDDCISLNGRNPYSPSRQGVLLTSMGSVLVFDGSSDIVVSAPYSAIQEHNQWGWVPHE